MKSKSRFHFIMFVIIIRNQNNVKQMCNDTTKYEQCVHVYRQLGTHTYKHVECSSQCHIIKPLLMLNKPCSLTVFSEYISFLKLMYVCVYIFLS